MTTRTERDPIERIVSIFGSNDDLIKAINALASDNADSSADESCLSESDRTPLRVQNSAQETSSDELKSLDFCQLSADSIENTAIPVLKLLKCPLCSFTTKFQRGLSSHMTRMHRERRQEHGNTGKLVTAPSPDDNISKKVSPRAQVPNEISPIPKELLPTVKWPKEKLPSYRARPQAAISEPNQSYYQASTPATSIPCSSQLNEARVLPPSIGWVRGVCCQLCGPQMGDYIDENARLFHTNQHGIQLYKTNCQFDWQRLYDECFPQLLVDCSNWRPSNESFAYFAARDRLTVNPAKIRGSFRNPREIEDNPEIESVEKAIHFDQDLSILRLILTGQANLDAENSNFQPTPMMMMTDETETNCTVNELAAALQTLTICSPEVLLRTDETAQPSSELTKIDSNQQEHRFVVETEANQISRSPLTAHPTAFDGAVPLSVEAGEIEQVGEQMQQTHPASAHEATSQTAAGTSHLVGAIRRLNAPKRKPRLPKNVAKWIVDERLTMELSETTFEVYGIRIIDVP